MFLARAALENGAFMSNMLSAVKFYAPSRSFISLHRVQNS
jgi:hypothetical protein